MYLVRTKPLGDSEGVFDLRFVYRYGEPGELHEGGEVFKWRLLDRVGDRMHEYHGCVELPDGRRVALLEDTMASTGPYWRTNTVTDEDGTEWALPTLANRSQLGAWRKGVKAALFGPEHNPYGDARTYRGGVTFARAFSKRWDEGYARGQELKIALRGE